MIVGEIIMLEWFAAAIGPFHAVFGFIGLAAFWVPIFSKKGARRHVAFGKIFLYCAYVVLGSAGISVIYHLVRLSLADRGPAMDPTFSFMLFLGYLALVTLINVRHAIGVLRTKDVPDSLATPLNILMGRLAIAASIGLIAFTVIVRPSVWILLLALSPIGLGIGFGIGKYLSGNRPSQKQWLYEHLGGMIGAGIAFHTAFAVFGSTRLFDYQFEGLLYVLPWIAPAMIGIPATVIWSRYYQRKFGELATAA